MRLAHRLVHCLTIRPRRFRLGGLVGLLGLGLAGAGCGGGPTGQTAVPSCGAGSGGILSLSWTIDGSPATATTCAPIDHLILRLSSDVCGGVEIEPVPCALDRFRYDRLPEGHALVELIGVTNSGCVRAVGDGDLTLATSLPPLPTPLDLRSNKTCH